MCAADKESKPELTEIELDGGSEKPAETRTEVWVREVLLGVIICFAQVPESIAFALMAHVKAPVGLHAAWVIGLVCGLFGGRPGMVNGATGAFAAIINTFLSKPADPGGNGAEVELLFPSVMMAGVFMLLVWALGLNRLLNSMPSPVMDPSTPNLRFDTTAWSPLSSSALSPQYWPDTGRCTGALLGSKSHSSVRMRLLTSASSWAYSAKPPDRLRRRAPSRSSPPRVLARTRPVTATGRA